MHLRAHIASIVFALVVFCGVFELVRRKRLRERYALLWLGAGFVLLVMAVWKQGLRTFSNAVGIYYPPNAFFVLAFAFVLLLLVHFSTTVSRLADQTRVLAQRLALAEQELAAQRRDRESGANGQEVDDVGGPRPIEEWSGGSEGGERGDAAGRRATEHVHALPQARGHDRG